MNKKIFITILHDFLIFCLSFFIALLLRLDWNQSLYLMNELWSFCLLYASANIFFLHYFGLYHGIWRYASMHEIISIFKSKASPIYDHFGIYLGENKIYHHAVNRYPAIEELGKFYKAKLVDVYRYYKNEG